MAQEKYALLSVFNKIGIVEFASQLIQMGWSILASGGTARTIKQAGLAVCDVAEFVGGKAILGHRVVTLSQVLHSGLLATDSAKDVAKLESLGIPRIDLVCVDMYPLEDEIAKLEATLESVIEKTDIGGPTMLRSGAKGRRIVICDPVDRNWVLDWLSEGMEDEDTIRQQLAAKTEFTVAGYVLASAKFLGQGEYDGLLGTRARTLCYGENRRQANAALFTTKSAASDPLALSKFNLLEGKDPSFINMTDVHRLTETATHIGAGWDVNFGYVPLIAVAVKHGNACGAAVGDDPHTVVRKMVDGDPEAITGGLLLLNFEVTDEIAQLLLRHKMPGDDKRILDGVFAPNFTDGAVKALARKKTGKCRLVTNPMLVGDGLGRESLDTTRRFRPVRSGEFLVQDGDPFVLKLQEFELFNSQQRRDIVLGWGIGSTSNSNTIILVKDNMLIGGGTGQRSRVMACKVALLYADTYGHDTRGAVAYSDSFFPFPDGPEVLVKAGIYVIFATSGSICDKTVRSACKRDGVTLIQLPDSEARGFYGH